MGFHKIKKRVLERFTDPPAPPTCKLLPAMTSPANADLIGRAGSAGSSKPEPSAFVQLQNSRGTYKCKGLSQVMATSLLGVSTALVSVQGGSRVDFQMKLAQSKIF